MKMVLWIRYRKWKIELYLFGYLKTPARLWRFSMVEDHPRAFLATAHMRVGMYGVGLSWPTVTYLRET